MSVPVTFILCLVVAILAARRWSARPSIETASPWRFLLAIPLFAALLGVLVFVLLGNSHGRRASSELGEAREEFAQRVRSTINKARERGDFGEVKRAFREGLNEAARELRETGRTVKDFVHTSVRPPRAPVPALVDGPDVLERFIPPQANVSIDLNGRRVVVTETRSSRGTADRRTRRQSQDVTIKSLRSRHLLHPLASAVIMVGMLAAAAWVLRMSVRRLSRSG